MLTPVSVAAVDQTQLVLVAAEAELQQGVAGAKGAFVFVAGIAPPAGDGEQLAQSSVLSAPRGKGMTEVRPRGCRTAR
ncbi:hypothetical protein [Micromonospora sp. NPDC005173]|uniref:hypothetical protein n=1 Tax=Micromonospora sp. NPDC005173 TaxID=3157165 RepID=UPI0033A2C566